MPWLEALCIMKAYWRHNCLDLCAIYNLKKTSNLYRNSFPVSDHSPKFNDRLHPGHCILDFLVNQFLSDWQRKKCEKLDLKGGSTGLCERARWQGYRRDGEAKLPGPVPAEDNAWTCPGVENGATQLAPQLSLRGVSTVTQKGSISSIPPAAYQSRAHPATWPTAYMSSGGKTGTSIPYPGGWPPHALAASLPVA